MSARCRQIEGLDLLDEAMQAIAPHWQRFTQEGVLARIPGKPCEEVYAVYTHFENADPLAPCTAAR